MTIDALLAQHPPINTCWANEVGTDFFAEDVDLDADGWKDPWGNPIERNMFSDPSSDVVEHNSNFKWSEQHVITLIGDTLVKLYVYHNEGKNNS